MPASMLEELIGHVRAVDMEAVRAELGAASDAS
jgi:hypothetical protein